MVVGELNTNVDSVLAFASQIAWVLLIFYVVILFIATIFRRGPIFAFIQLFSFRVLVPFLLTSGLYLLSLSLVFVQPTQVGVVISVLTPGGIRPAPVAPGIHFVIPFIEQVVTYPIIWQTYTMSSKPTEGDVLGDDSIRARTADGQEVYLDTSIIFRIDSVQAVQVHIDWQNRYVQDLVRPLIQGYVRTQVSQFTVDEVNSDNRADLEITLDRLLREEMNSKGFIVDQFLLRDVTFSPQYAEAIEEKQVAFEEQSRALYEAERERRLARGIADALEIEAEGRARAVEQIGEALSANPSMLTYYYIERLSPAIRALLVPNNNPLILPLPELDELGEALPEDNPTDTPPESDSTGTADTLTDPLSRAEN